MGGVLPEMHANTTDVLVHAPAGGFNMKAATAALLVVAGMTAQAAEPATLTLACKGTVTIKTSGPLEYEPDSVSMGLIVQLHDPDGPWDRALGSLSLRRPTPDNRMERGDRCLQRFQQISW
jgi:hypothetical protein